MLSVWRENVYLDNRIEAMVGTLFEANKVVEKSEQIEHDEGKKNTTNRLNLSIFVFVEVQFMSPVSNIRFAITARSLDGVLVESIQANYKNKRKGIIATLFSLSGIIVNCR